MIAIRVQSGTAGRAVVLTVAVIAAILLVLAGCESLGSIAEVGTGVAVATGRMTEQQAASVTRSAEAIGRSFEDITPEQEYYIGRAVGATILDQYAPYDEQAATDYLNLIGQSLAMASDRPELFGGYRFMVLDSEEVNAFATPSGLIFVSRGLLRLTRSEDDVAAVLAHEIGHVQHRHGLQAIRTSRITAALTSTAITGAQFATSQEIAELTEVFEDSINDVTTTLVNNGYSRSAEREADQAAVEIMKRIGYDPEALIRVLERMDEDWVSDGPGFMRTHPAPRTRIEVVRNAIGTYRHQPAGTAERQRRYERALGSV
ncbi:MAG: peptidase M48 [Spirochaetaceae bacterium]|nr:MAG: peptidase M48 [Spirochaetaceae bacterium]